MAVAERFTSADLALIPDDNKRYEIIEGELYVSKSPGFEHQYTCSRLCRFLDEWNVQSNPGVVLTAPGVVIILGKDDARRGEYDSRIALVVPLINTRVADFAVFSTSGTTKAIRESYSPRRASSLPRMMTWCPTLCGSAASA